MTKSGGTSDMQTDTKKKVVSVDTNEIMMRSGNYRWNILMSFIIFHHLSLSFEKVIADSSRYDTFPVFFHENVTRMVNNE